MINILVVEDQAMVLGALSALINLEPDMHVIATACNGREALDICEIESVDVIISDIEMPVMNGLQLAKILNINNHPAKIIMLTTFSRPGYVQQAIDVGISAYLLKDTPSETLAKTIRQTVKGEVVIQPSLLMEAFKMGGNPLTEKEKSILSLAYEGKSSNEISVLLNLSTGTVRNYLHNTCQKLQTKNRIEAAKTALENGWLIQAL